MATNSINIIDDFFSYEDFLDINNVCNNAEYLFGTKDYGNNSPTGMTHPVQPNTKMYDLFKSSTQKFVDDHLIFHSIIINCFAPSENPYFHPDFDQKGCITFIYYPNTEWDMDWGGETQLLIDGEIRGIIPKPNRMAYFDSTIWHKATPFRDNYRFTVAIKYVVPGVTLPEYYFSDQFKYQ